MISATRNQLYCALPIGLFAAVVIGSGIVLATPPMVPKITSETILGVWEAVNPNGPEILRLDMRKSGPSYVAIAVGSAEPAEAAVFRVSEIQFDHDEVFVTADDLTKQSSLSLGIRGVGRASHGWGSISGTITLRDRRVDRSVRQWTGQLLLIEGGYVRNLERLSLAAAKGIQVIETVR